MANSRTFAKAFLQSVKYLLFYSDHKLMVGSTTGKGRLQSSGQKHGNMEKSVDVEVDWDDNEKIVQMVEENIRGARVETWHIQIKDLRLTFS